MKKLLVLYLIFSPIIILNSIAQNNRTNDGLQLFKNIEQIEYCVLLPLNEYVEKRAVERANHSFVNKKNNALVINLKGYYSDDKSITLEKLCALKYTAEDEKHGKIIKTKVISNINHCFYAIGYYNNLIYKYEFIEITWVRNDEITVLELNYRLKDQALWQKRLKTIIKNSECPE